MKLKSINMFMKHGVKDGAYRARFRYRTYIIGFYLSMQLHKLNFETDETFDALAIEVGSDTESVGYDYSPVDKLTFVINLPFDFNRYESVDCTQRSRYYIELLQKGLLISRRYKDIPYDEIMSYAKELEEMDFVYCWPFKNVLLREYGVKVKFTNVLSLYDYVLYFQAYEKKIPIPLCEGRVARTKPSNLDISYISKKIEVEDNHIIIKDEFGHRLLTIDIKSLLKGKLNIEYAECPRPEDKSFCEVFYRLQKNVRYDEYDLK